MERALNGVFDEGTYDLKRLRQHTFVWHLPDIFEGIG